MRIGNNRGEITRSQELNYLLTWFAEFSEMQKDDFLQILVNKYGATESHDGETVANGVCGMQVTERPPSIFKCRMKLFNEWFENWNEEEKKDFLTRVKNVDEQFMELFHKTMDKTPSMNGDAATAVNGNASKEEEKECIAINGDA
ncbi:uncharacterized protein B4U80_01006 [Leptotrombidium deliense]|uniref:Uncharacterized protein n=1 Tax=Leptotrombidium deliense TaxID=299467 RepID=A0A443SNI2_9ACAR|nr:uncharacterized protein B4U80_01006 [Leptotrombidium deliense]